MSSTIKRRFNIAGVQYSDYQAAKLKLGMTLVLEHEEDNEFDRNAITVSAGKVRIGYVPKQINKDLNTITSLETNQELLGLIDKGWKCKARLTSINKQNPTWMMFVMEVVLTRPLAKKTKKRRRIA